MKDGLVETAKGSKLRLDLQRSQKLYEGRLLRATCMERVVISAQPVQRCLDREGLLLDDRIRRPLRRLVGGGSWSAIGTISRTTKPPRSSYEDRRLVLKDDLSRVLVLGHHARSNGSGFTLVEDLNKFDFVDERGTRGDRALYREVLLAVK